MSSPLSPEKMGAQYLEGAYGKDGPALQMLCAAMAFHAGIEAAFKRLEAIPTDEPEDKSVEDLEAFREENRETAHALLLMEQTFMEESEKVGRLGAPVAGGKEYLREMANIVAAKLPDNFGFILLAFPLGDDPGRRVVYVSNADRKDAINALKEWLIKCGAEEDWMQHLP